MLEQTEGEKQIEKEEKRHEIALWKMEILLYSPTQCLWNSMSRETSQVVYFSLQTAFVNIFHYFLLFVRFLCPIKVLKRRASKSYAEIINPLALFNRFVGVRFELFSFFVSFVGWTEVWEILGQTFLFFSF